VCLCVQGERWGEGGGLGGGGGRGGGGCGGVYMHTRMNFILLGVYIVQFVVHFVGCIDMHAGKHQSVSCMCV